MHDNEDHCPDCGLLIFDGDLGHKTDCPVRQRWEAVRPSTCPCCGEPTTETWTSGAVRERERVLWNLPWTSCPSVTAGRRAAVDDERWFAAHPDVNKIVRELSAAEQLVSFLFDGVPKSHVRLTREQETVEVGKTMTRTIEVIRRRDCGTPAAGDT